MTNIRASAAGFFRQQGLRPGCYDDPAFLELERTDPRVLEDYAAYVVERAQSTTEEAHAREMVERAFARLIGHVPQDQLQRRCATVGQLLMKVLEEHGIWCFAVTGSVRYVFDEASGLEPRITYCIDRQDVPGAFVGHSWLVVPPFDIVDCTARFQSWSEGQAALIPSPILARGARAVAAEYEISVAPDSRAAHPPRSFAAHYFDLWRRFPPREVVLPNVTITYQAHGISAPDAPLGDMRNLVSDPVKLFADLGT